MQNGMEVLSAQVAAAAAEGLPSQQQHSPGSQVGARRKQTTILHTVYIVRIISATCVTYFALSM